MPYLHFINNIEYKHMIMLCVDVSMMPALVIMEVIVSVYVLLSQPMLRSAQTKEYTSSGETKTPVVSVTTICQCHRHT